MRSYYAHLETMTPKAQDIPAKPVFRSSAIFPAVQTDKMTTRLLFMGYWMLKRNIEKMASVVTLRSQGGDVIARKLLTITEAKAFSVELSSMLECGGQEGGLDFEGSLEIEFYSATNLLFAYPAVVVNYYGEEFSSVVHVAQRVYNDYDDMQKNSQTSVAESGFNVRADRDVEPFIGLINGAAFQQEAKIEFQFFNNEGKILSFTKELGTLKPYETAMLFPARDIDLEDFLGGNEGTCKAKFQVSWIFPRLLVGNREKQSDALSITHTYYDCSSAETPSDYWRFSDPKWYLASLMLPLSLKGDRYTNVYFYPIYSPSTFVVDVEIYSAEGKLLGTEKEVLTLVSPGSSLSCIAFDELIDRLDIKGDRDLAARIIARPKGDSLMPSRIKLALDIGHKDKGLPCNICMNLQPYNPSLESKPSSFKWLPILAESPISTIWLMNSSPRIEHSLNATVKLTFFREKDVTALERTIKLEAQGFIVISPEEDEELKIFLDGATGWVTAITDNPYLTTYYFADSISGIIGGDHGF